MRTLAMRLVCLHFYSADCTCTYGLDNSSDDINLKKNTKETCFSLNLYLHYMLIHNVFMKSFCSFFHSVLW